jgi:hypothetical protein
VDLYKGPKILAHFCGICNGQKASDEAHLTEVINTEAAALDNTLEGSRRDGLPAVRGHNHLTAIRMPPFLMAALLTD